MCVECAQVVLDTLLFQATYRNVHHRHSGALIAHRPHTSGDNTWYRTRRCRDSVTRARLHGIPRKTAHGHADPILSILCRGQTAVPRGSVVVVKRVWCNRRATQCQPTFTLAHVNARLAHDAPLWCDQNV